LIEVVGGTGCLAVEKGDGMMPLRTWSALIVLAAVAGYSCGSTPAGPSRLPAGVWGGDHVTLEVADARVHLELDCAHGDIPVVPALDREGQFEDAGAYVREHGGPIRQGEIPDTHPAIYSGRVAATTMSLTIRLSDTSERIGAFTLESGSSGRVVKCL
jgi:hypothetical protein